MLVSTVLRLPTVLTAEPNLPLATAAETISDLLRDAPDETKSAYARVLAYSVPKLTPIDVLPIDRPKLFQNDSPLMCLILTHGTVLRDLVRDYPQIRTFLEACRLAINDESQQGGHAGFAILATCASKFSQEIVSKPGPAPGGTNSGNLSSNDCHTRVSVFWGGLPPVSRLK